MTLNLGLQTGKRGAADPAHDPGTETASERAAVVSRHDAAPIAVRSGQVRIGTAGWTDPTLTTAGVFYPPGTDSAEERLRYYSTVFPVVEVDSTYYALPARRNAELWLERTDPGFVFDFKAHALMTGQPTEVKRLPRPLRDALPGDLQEKTRIYGKDLPPELYDAVWEQFRDALEPLHEAGRMGSVLLQFPRWFFPGGPGREAIRQAQEKLKPFQCAVEFRNGAWLNDHNREKTLQFLSEQRIPFVMVDGPQGMKSSIPPMVAITSPDLAVVRFHGRRTETWEAKGVGVEERFKYLYEPQELAEWTPRVSEAAGQAKQVHVIMNNCYANYGTTNALEFAELLRRNVEPETAG